MKTIYWLAFILMISFQVFAQNSLDNLKANILFIVADDLGYADLGCFGSDIATPNLDKLAGEGIRFSRYHSAPLCAVARSMFLTGNDNHIAGMGIQGRVTGVEGYEGRLTERVVTVPALLRENGYFTCMAGKWHLGLEPRSNPAVKGFDRSFVLLEGAANHYSSLGALNQRPLSIYTEDGKEAFWPEGAYSTDFYTDKIIQQLKEAKKAGKPFFAFAAYTSPHWPLQVDSPYWAKYDGKYHLGYEVQRQVNFENLIRVGLIPRDAQLPALHEKVKPWNSLSEERKKWEARAMALYAGMVENLDANIGRLIDYLKTSGEYENTLIVFVSDNGAAAEDFYNSDTSSTFLRENYTEAYDVMGMPHSYISYGRPWAEAGSAPFRYFKGYTTEGGIVAPMIISGRGVLEKGKISHSFVTLLDLAPTFYQLAGVAYPTVWLGNQIHPLGGESISKIFSNTAEQIHNDNYLLAFETNGNIWVRKGEWKIINTLRPIDESNFMLFNLTTDMAEQHDIKALYPQKFQELLIGWREYVKKVKVRSDPPREGEGL